MGLGLVRYDVPSNHRYFGKMMPCPNRPKTVDEIELQRLKRLSNLDAFGDKTFANFEVNPRGGYTDKEQQSLETALNMSSRYAESLDGWLILEGSYGGGKTHLATAVGNERLKRGELVIFMTVPDLLDHLRSTYSPSSESSYDAVFDRVRDANLLILDDLGVENPSPWAHEKLFQLLNHRYTYKKSTVITTNVSLDDLDPRLSSRLRDHNFAKRVAIDVPDYRSTDTADTHSNNLLSRLNLHRQMLFENFDIQRNLTVDEHENLRRAMQTATDYAQNPQGWLLFLGDYGTGKTHLAAAIANFRQQRTGAEVMFMTAPDLLDYLRTTFSPDSNITFDELFNRIRNVSMLVIDDLGGESNKGWAQEKLFQLLDYRYVSQLPTVMTTAKPLEDLNQRLASRLLDDRICRNIAIQAPMYAMRMKRR